MKIIKGLVQGTLKDEAEFKSAVLKAWRKKSPWFTRFEIENEEKAPGMPDVLSMSNKLPAFFTEFKISDAKGVIEFQKTQPLFYKQNSELNIDILAWDAPRKRVVCIQPQEVLSLLNKLKLKLPEEIDDVEAVG
jgi:hypothetical protein